MKEQRGETHRAARAAGHQPQGLLHRPRQVGARQGRLAPARRRRVPADQGLAAPRPLPRAHASSCRSPRSRCKPREREAAARTRSKPALEIGKGVVHVCCGGWGDRDDADLLGEARLPVVRPQLPRARPAPLLVQLEARLVRRLLRHGPEDRRGGVGRGALAAPAPRTTCSTRGSNGWSSTRRARSATASGSTGRRSRCASAASRSPT